MDLQDILFYIVIGFVGIISYLSQRKAKKQAEEIERRRRQQQETTSGDTLVTDHREVEPPVTTHQEAMPQEELSLDEIFKALRERKPLPAKPVKPQIQEISGTAPPTPPIQTVKPSATVQVRAQVRGSKPEQASSKETNTMPTNTEKHTYGHKSINWREAFIASEILNRKY